jgi:predicted Zn-dependent peptidase
MRGVEVACACETAYVGISFSVGLDEPLERSFKKRTRQRSPRGSTGPAMSGSAIAHLAEHVVATLTSSADQDNEAALHAVRSTGLVQNAETTAHETCFYVFGMPRDIEETWIPRIFAAIRDPNVSDACVETERSAALDETYGLRANLAVTGGKLDEHIAHVEATGSWITRVDRDIAFLEREQVRRIGDAIGSFIRKYYVQARMHVTVVGSDPRTTMRAVRRAAARIGADAAEDAVLPRAVYAGRGWRGGSVSVIDGSEGDTTRVRIIASMRVTAHPLSVAAVECAAWCAKEALFVELRVRSRSVYSVHAELILRAVTSAERNGDHDASISVGTVCTADKAPLVARAILDALARGPTAQLVEDWRRAVTVSIRRESKTPLSIGERVRAVCVGATLDPIARADRLALVESVTHAAACAAATGEYRVYASTGDADRTQLKRAMRRALAGNN